jgi:hypothetical protein
VSGSSLTPCASVGTEATAAHGPRAWRAGGDNPDDELHEHAIEPPDEVPLEPLSPHPGSDPVEVSTEPRCEHPQRQQRRAGRIAAGHRPHPSR